MASVSLDKFSPFVVAEAPGVPEPVALDAVRNACFDFCRRSLWWTERMDTEAYASGESTYQVLAPPGAVVVAVLSVNIDGERIVAPSVMEDVDRSAPGAWATAGPVATFVQLAPDVLQFLPTPNKSGVYTCIAAFAPSRSATSVPDSLFSHYFETIVHGAISKLKRMPGQAWSDPSGALFYDQLFWKGVNSALLERNRGPARAEMRVGSMPFV